MNHDPNFQKSNFWKSESIGNILKILLVFLFVATFLSLSFLLSSLNDLGLELHKEPYPDGYYNFFPNDKFYYTAQQMSSSIWPHIRESELMTKLAEEWKIGKDVKLIFFVPKELYSTDEYVIYTYYRPFSYPVEWDEAKVDLKEGRWFHGTEDSVICMNGKNFQVNDSISIKDSSGKFTSFTIIGKTKRKHFRYSGLGLFFSPNEKRKKSIFLLNPLSELNIPSDELPIGDSFMLKIENPLITKKIEEYGELVPLSFLDFSNKEPETIRNNFNLLIDRFNFRTLFFFLIFAVSLCLNLYFIHKLSFEKKRGSTFIISYVVSLVINGFLWGFRISIIDSVIVVPTVLLLDYKLSKEFVHGRSYIVEDQKEIDVEI